MNATNATACSTYTTCHKLHAAAHSLNNRVDRRQSPHIVLMRHNCCCRCNLEDMYRAVASLESLEKQVGQLQAALAFCRQHGLIEHKLFCLLLAAETAC